MKQTCLLICSSLLSLSNGSTHRPLHETQPPDLSSPPLQPNIEDAHPYMTEDGRILLPDNDVFKRRNLRTRTQERPRHQKRRHLTAGTFHNLVLLLQFADHTSRPLPPRSHYDLLYNSPSVSKEIVPTGSVKNYFHTNSYGTFDIQSTVVGWITLSKSESYYANGDYGFVKLQEAIIEALEWMESEGYDFADFDANNDGVVDGFGILISGYGAEFAGADCYNAANVNRIWSHKGGINWTSDNGITVDRYYVSSGLRNKCNSDIARMGVICHELGHYLGLPDLYDNTFEGSGIGALDVMSQSWGWDGTGVYPPLLSAWSKVSVGWVTPTVIDLDGTYELENSETSDKVYRIDSGFPEGEYLLLENRQPDGFDSEIPHGGIAIWHIDEKASQNARGHPGQDSWPENGQHYRIALLPADGNYDLEKGVNQGDAHDLWHKSSTNVELKAGGDKYPNTDSYQEGLVTETGIRIHDFSSSKGKMSFKVEGLPKRTTEAPTKLPSLSPSLHPVTAAPTKLETMHPSAHPSNSPSTQSPVITFIATDTPTAHPSTAPIVTFTATEPPTKVKTKAPVTPRPTPSPITEAERCANRCFDPLPSSECPLNKAYVNCKFSYVGGVCYSEDDECGADPTIANCQGFAVYKRVNCNDITIASWSDTDTNEPSSSPTHKPTMLFITGNGSYTSSGSSAEGSCKYYPGWSTGLSYCISDCDVAAPEGMKSNPLYEFASIDLCCNAHFQRKERCKRASLDASENNSTEVELASLSGTIWSDSNEDQRRDSTESGLQGAIIDLYECDYNTWVKGTRTNQDGLYELSRIPPGKYSLKITAPNDFHFIFDAHFWRNEDLDPSIATTPCYELRPLDDNSNFSVGVIPNSISVPELVSITDEPKSVVDSISAPEVPSIVDASLAHSKSASASQVSNTSAASHSKSSRDSSRERPVASKPLPIAKEQVQIAPDTTNYLSTSTKDHNKSSSRNKVAIQATECITISQQQNISVDRDQDLKVSKYEDIILKFDVSFLKDKTPTSAVLRLYSLSSSPVGGSVHIASHNLWNVNIVTWDDAPAIGDAVNDIGSTHPNEWVEVDITGALKTNNDEFISLRINMGASDSHWSAKYSRQKVQIRVSF